jgi:TRAP-type mannitol/chloroaromatic compound transport system permease large subunit
MEAINSGVFDLGVIFFFVKKLFLGTVAFGFLIGGIYFAYYLLNLYRLPRESKRYKHQCEHLQKENLIRYIITIACMLLISGLFYFGIEIGRESMLLGAVVWAAYYSIKYLR